MLYRVKLGLSHPLFIRKMFFYQEGHGQSWWSMSSLGSDFLGSDCGPQEALPRETLRGNSSHIFPLK